MKLNTNNQPRQVIWHQIISRPLPVSGKSVRATRITNPVMLCRARTEFLITPLRPQTLPVDIPTPQSLTIKASSTPFPYPIALEDPYDGSKEGQM
ncbi:hypothetical protein THAOC_31762 [Thalassiosira oceanica]|uniref:Uncharacterized protein n=1 Tax=Thalassiosira oceanica TaxID=159749 RepID=K0R8K1_THAOC|nr:hypothetical protein THAOC_31762 [Thalassiosira oceanica]|eukprot:EJK49365.1 hypothetical protein THAOC_31762 [Thalassiosira oceanica]